MWRLGWSDAPGAQSCAQIYLTVAVWLAVGKASKVASVAVSSTCNVFLCSIIVDLDC